MRTRGLGRSIMAGGVVCGIIYGLLAMRGASPLNVRVGGILFYVCVVAIPLGAILLWTSEIKRSPVQWRKAGRDD
jgi:xanthosine utilization system XapX-like protein